MLTIRDATVDDAGTCAAIYAPYVRDTAISFEEHPPSVSEMADRMAAAHEWILAEDGDRVVGYAYAGPFNDRHAYRFTCAVSVYLDTGCRRTGAGRALYEDLFARLRARGYVRATAGITLPNEASVGLHTALGFAPVGTFPRVGWKFDAWHDVTWMQRDL